MSLVEQKIIAAKKPAIVLGVPKLPPSTKVVMELCVRVHDQKLPALHMHTTTAHCTVHEPNIVVPVRQ